MVEVELINATLAALFSFGGYFAVVKAAAFSPLAAFMFIATCLRDSLNQLTSHKSGESFLVLVLNVAGLIISMVAVIMILSFCYDQNEAAVEWGQTLLCVSPVRSSMLFIRCLGINVQKRYRKEK